MSSYINVEGTRTVLLVSFIYQARNPIYRGQTSLCSFPMLYRLERFLAWPGPGPYALWSRHFSRLRENWDTVLNIAVLFVLEIFISGLVFVTFGCCGQRLWPEATYRRKSSFSCMAPEGESVMVREAASWSRNLRGHISFQTQGAKRANQRWDRL